MTVHPEIVVALVGLLGLVMYATPFLFYVREQFQDIRSKYSTISAFSAGPYSWGGKFLLGVCFISAYSLFLLFLSEHQAARSLISAQVLPLPQWQFTVQSVISLLLPLIGVFHTNGSGRILFLYCGPRAFRTSYSMTMSTALHSVAALLFMGVMPALQLYYLVEVTRLSHPHSPTLFVVTMLWLTCLNIVLLLAFLIIQTILAFPLLLSSSWAGVWNCCRCPWHNTCFRQTLQTGPRVLLCQLCDDPDHNAEIYCPRCAKVFCDDYLYAHNQLCFPQPRVSPPPLDDEATPTASSALEAKGAAAESASPIVGVQLLDGVSTPNSPADTCELSTNTTQVLYVVSFTLEALLVLLTVGITALLSLARNPKLDWNVL